MNNITFVIFTYNEEKRIEKVIKNFINYGRILIADNKSTDKTCEIALSYGCEILVRENSYVFVENQEMVDLIYSKLKTDWIYWGFADEMLEKSCIEQILTVIKNDKHDIINIDRKNYFYGKFCYDLYHARSNKIFKKNAIDFNGNVIHGMGRPTVADDKIYQLPDKYFVHHFISNTASSYLNVINRYTDEETKFNYKAKLSVINLFIVVAVNILKGLFYKNNGKAKTEGLALIQLMIFYELIKNIKCYETEKGISVLTNEDKNNTYRDKILLDFK